MSEIYHWASNLVSELERRQQSPDRHKAGFRPMNTFIYAQAAVPINEDLPSNRTKVEELIDVVVSPDVSKCNSADSVASQ